MSTHGGTITGPGVPTVLIGGLAAAVVGDVHACALPLSQAHPTPSPFLAGSTTVLIGGRPAVRVGDPCLCAAAAAVGEPTVIVG